MTLSVQQAIEQRTSVNNFQAGRPLSDEAITTLINLATKSPSAYNMQNWRFIAVRSEEAKEKLKAAAFGQQKITDASVAFIICGTLEAHKQLPDALKPSVENGIMPQRTAEGWQAQADRSHEGNPELQRDEAIRSASLASMTLMLAAEEMGLGTCPMIGFDAQQVTESFALSQSELPAMIVTVGYAQQENWPQKPRKALPQVLAIV